MANVIKHKRGSGSDPVASDLVVGEVAIRTDVGKLFTKMDNGTVAEIAGGGSDIAINTLSSSSGTGGGSATFNGSAYRFTLSAPPSVSAQQLLVSINGVIQKPVAGTGQPSEGFSVDGTDIILGDAPATGSDFFILTFKSLGVSEPADNSVTSAKIVDGTIVNADINASAAIAGSKISPIFTSATEVQNSTFKITDSNPEILLAVPSGGLDSRIINDGSGNLIIGHGVNSDTPTERMRIDSSGNMLLGMTSTSFPKRLNVQGSSGAIIALKNSDTTSYAQNTNTSIEFGLNTGNTGNQVGACEIRAFKENGTNGNNARALSFYTGLNGGSPTERMRIDSAGKVFIGTTSGSERLKVETTANTMVPMTINDSSNTSTLTHRILFSTGGTEVGRIRCTNSATQYNTSGSDRSMKKNFELWDEDVLSLFKNINPQKFNFIQEEDGATKSKGFIAQELANSFPEAYSKGEKEDDKYWFNPSGMVVYLMKALQEAVARIEALEAK